MKVIGTHIDASSIRPIIGFSLFWAWIDAALVGLPLARNVAQNTLFGDLTSMISVLFCIVTYLLCYLSPALYRCVLSRSFKWAIAAVASVGAFLVSTEDIFSIGTMTVGLAFIGLGMGAIILLWAEDYASDLQKRGYVWVAGSIALSFPLYLVAVELSDWMRIIAVAILPLISCALLKPCKDLSVPVKSERRIISRNANEEGSLADTVRVMGFPCNVAFWFAAFGFVFGIMQNFSDPQPLLDSVLMDFQQGGRALAAVIFFVGLCVFSWKPHTAYRLSTSLVLVGLVLVPIFGSNGGFAAGFIAHMAYGFFECMTWAIVFETMRVRKTDAGATVGAARLLSAAGLLIGTLLVVIARDGFTANTLQMQSILSSSVCILVIATMMILDTHSDNNVWAMMKARAASDAHSREAETDGGFRRAVMTIGQAHGLTDRETDIFLLLAQGRTSPYISSELLIGVNTVNTHKRRIYQKLGIHTKQELIDKVAHFQTEDQ